MLNTYRAMIAACLFSGYMMGSENFDCWDKKSDQILAYTYYKSSEEGEEKQNSFISPELVSYILYNESQITDCTHNNTSLLQDKLHKALFDFMLKKCSEDTMNKALLHYLLKNVIEKSSITEATFFSSTQTSQLITQYVETQNAHSNGWQITKEGNRSNCTIL